MESEETKRRLLYADHEEIFSWLDESKHVQGIGSVSRWFSEQMVSTKHQLLDGCCSSKYWAKSFMRCQESIADHILPSGLTDDGFLWTIVPSFYAFTTRNIQFDACKCMHAAIPAGEPKFLILNWRSHGQCRFECAVLVCMSLMNFNSSAWGWL